MIKIITVCGNGIGSSNLLAMKITQLAKKKGIKVEARPSDFNGAQGESPDVFVTVEEFAKQFSPDKKVIVVRSYADKAKIEEDVLPTLIELSKSL